MADEELRPIVVTLLKATYDFDVEGVLTLADEQIPANLTGEFWSDAPESSYKYEPETAFYKPGTDVVLIGHARSPGNGATSVDVGIKVGPVQKVARVFGDRFWLQNQGEARMTRAAPLEPIPLTWEHAFGGGNTAGLAAEMPSFDSRNPVGTGFGTPLRQEGDSLRLPNIENPNEPIERYGVAVTPWGFGFTSPNWQPRAAFAGTFGEEWNATRKPLLPADFDRRFFNAAPPGLIAPAFLQGNEEVVLLNVGAAPRTAFQLPGVPPPRCTVVLRNQVDVPLVTNLDTIIVNADDQRLMLLWRAYALAGEGPHDVRALVADS